MPGLRRSRRGAMSWLAPRASRTSKGTVASRPNRRRAELAVTSAATPALRLVNADTGEVVEDGCPQCSVKDDEIAGLQRNIRGWAVRCAKLERDREAEACAHELWPVALRIVEVWRRLCGHPRADFGADEFEPMIRFLSKRVYGETLDDRVAMCLRAVAGAAYDPSTRALRNGKVERYDGLTLIFRTQDKFRSFVRRAPKNWREMVGLESDASGGQA